MPVQIRRADLYSYVINALERDIGEFKQAIADHAKSEGVPAPIAIHSLVDAIARSPDGAFIVAEDVAEAARDQTPYVTVDQHNQLMARVSDTELRAPIHGAHEELVQRVRELEAEVHTIRDQVKTLMGAA